MIGYRSQDRAFFLYGFSKNERDNIDDDEMETLKELAKAWLEANDQKIKRSLKDGLLQEVLYE